MKVFVVMLEYHYESNEVCQISESFDSAKNYILAKVDETWKWIDDVTCERIHSTYTIEEKYIVP